MKVWLVGSGAMSLSYASVLQALGVDIRVIGRGEHSAAEFKAACGLPVTTGGLRPYLSGGPPVADAAIVSVGVEALFEAAELLVDYGVKRILIEKPGALDVASLTRLHVLAGERGAEVFVGYNRRYYGSVRRMQELIAEDGGIRSCFFEFTEWGHEIETLTKGEGVKERWLLSNSSHVIDLVFHLIGAPSQLNVATQGALEWHPSASIFVGSGVSERGVPFSYHSNWDAPGRWGVEVMTRNMRFFLRPMETLQKMRKGSVAIEQVPFDDAIDRQFKPGLHRQVSDFLSGVNGDLCTVDAQIAMWPVYCKIGSYQP